MHTVSSMKSVVHPRVPATRPRVILWFAILTAVLIIGLFHSVTEAAPGQSTIPPSSKEFTVLVGPIDAMGSTAWTVAGIPIQITDETKINERQTGANGDNWARVEGAPDGAGGLIADRIKILPQQRFVRLEGPLQELSDSQFTVSGIILGRTSTTILIGSPTVGNRVHVAAAIQTDGSLLALQVKTVGPPDDDDDDDGDGASTNIELTGVVIERPNSIEGDWNISGIPVTVNAQTEVKQRVGNLIPGAWVKVEGTATGDGGIVATEMKVTETRRFHKLEGTLDSLTEEQVVVNGIAIALADDVKLEDNPTVGQRVEVKARYSQTQEKLFAFQVEGERDDDDDHQGSQTRHIAGELKQLPEDGLFGDWKVGPKTITVTSSTVIDEHKGLVEEGAVIWAEVLKNGDGSMVAIQVVVLRGANNDDDDDDDNDDDHHKYIEFEEAIRSLPGNGLRGEWQVGDYIVVVTRKTEIKGDADRIDVDVEVKVEGYLMNDGKVLAREIKVEEEEEDDHDNDTTFEGEIKQLPPTGLEGIWVVENKQVKVTSHTEIDTSNGEVERGATVRVTGYEHRHNVFRASKIVVLEPAED